MSLTAFVPTNTQKARTTAIAAFKRMLDEENVSMDFIQASIGLDASGKRLAATMDRFGFYLATNDGKKGKLARNTATSYHRNVKLWLFDQFPHLRVPTELILLKQGKTLDKHCMKREKGGFVNKAPPCTKDDLASLIRYVYSTARVATDYQDAALACLMWHCFGRSSDIGYIQKQHVSVSVDGTFYLRILRVKTSEEQGLTLIPDKSNFLTCPLHALGVALAMPGAPCAALLDQLPELVSNNCENLDEDAPLHDLLSADPTTLQVAVVPTGVAATEVDCTSTLPLAFSQINEARPSLTNADVQEPTEAKAPTKRGEDSVQAYVNRMLKRVTEPAGATSFLTSHSFRRGGAQHANGDDHLAAQWIFDRGAWDMTKTNKAFAYITNTAREDRKVARVLSGWKADESPTILDVAALDHASQERLGRLQMFLFSSCTGLKQQRLNVSTKVLSVLTAYLVRNYPQLKELAPASPIVTRVEECLVSADITIADTLAWSVALNTEAVQPGKEQEKNILSSFGISYPAAYHVQQGSSCEANSR
ncbi:hypothetical protein AM587_10008642 [Phytophthora nicotianae]|uniref:Uncharacterized protein n=1 Tax=Phytophthora nicotianae TaxID=4792 RepID=A0A0W8C2Y9_PHYNI|nr:hypothetical protein AM587_10008642 [Phytophthora nicotianae]